jgi:integrase
VADSDPTFHVFGSEWFNQHKGEWREGTQADYRWQLEGHLFAFFKDHHLSQITVAEVDRYRQHEVDQGVLGATSINKCLTRLGQILEVAVERELMGRNPVRVNSKRRRLKAVRPQRTLLDRAEQIVALLDAAADLDAEARVTAKLHRRALLATLTFAGLRISELIALDWADVDLAGGRLYVRASKTDAGVREVDLLPVLAAELRALKAEVLPSPDDAVFPSAAGTRQDRNRVRSRVLGKAIERADKRLTKAELAPLPEGLTLHGLRRTFASLLVALGHDAAYVMAQMGHTSPQMTLGLYAKSVRPADRDRLRALANGEELALTGTGGASEAPVPNDATQVAMPETASQSQ